jgi:hypothetical protein
MADGSILAVDDTTAPYLEDRGRALRQAQAEQMLLRQTSGPSPALNGSQEQAASLPPQLTLYGRGARATVASSPVLDDITDGLAESPRAVVRGFLDAAANLIHSGDDLEMWLGSLSPEEVAKLPMPLQINAAAAKLIPQEWIARWDAAVKAAPDKIIAPPKSVTGNLISGTIEFIAGMKVLTGAMKGLRLAAPIEGALASGGSMATAFDPAQDTLAELMQSNPTLAKLVPDFLASQPGDTEAEKRLKNFLEGAALSFIADGFIRALKVYKAAHGSVPDTALAEHGNADGPLIQALADPQQSEIEIEASAGIQPNPKDVLIEPSPAEAESSASAAEPIQAEQQIPQVPEGARLILDTGTRSIC